MASGYDNPDSELILTHAHAISKSDRFDLIGFYDIDSDKAIAAAQKWNSHFVDDIDSIKNEVDIVCCTAPDECHYDIMKGLLTWPALQGVICEKPVTDSIDSAENLGQLYASGEKPVIVNYTRRYNKEFEDIKKWIDANAGKLITGTCVYGKGIIHNCSHMINLLQFLFGKVKIAHVGKSYIDYKETDPSVDFSIEIKGAPVYIHPIPCDVVTVFEFDLCFEKGRIRYDDTDGTIRYYSARRISMEDDDINYQLVKQINIDRSRALTSLYDNLYDAIESSAPVKASLKDSIETLRICDSVRRQCINGGN